MPISIHAPREGSDTPWARDEYYASYISIHAPREGSDEEEYGNIVTALSISIHAPREGSDRGPVCRPERRQISIHAPREGSDTRALLSLAEIEAISIHAPREGSDPAASTRSCEPSAFLSTLPARGATGSFGTTTTCKTYFYPRSPRGERPSSSLRGRMT